MPFLDPAGGKHNKDLKSTRARSAIVVVGVDYIDRIWVLEAWADRCHTDEIIRRIFEMNAKWKPKVFGIEANAMQSLFADAVMAQAKMQGVRVPILPVMQPTRVKKEFRIRAALQPVFAEHRLLFHAQSQQELLKEVRSFPRGQVVDLVDALASVVSLVPRRKPKKQRDAGRDKLAAYLRRRGAPAGYIQKRVAGYGAKHG